MTIPPIIVPGTTNLIENPDLAENDDGWLNAGVVTRTRVPTSVSPHADFAVEVGTDASAEGVAVLSVPLTLSGGSFVGSADVWGEGALQPRIYITYADSSSDNTSRGTAVTLAGEAQRISVVVTPDPAKTVTLLRLYLVRPSTVVGTFYATAAQIEAGSVATSFVVGTRPERHLPGSLKIGSSHIGPLRVGERN